MLNFTLQDLGNVYSNLYRIFASDAYQSLGNRSITKFLFHAYSIFLSSYLVFWMIVFFPHYLRENDNTWKEFKNDLNQFLHRFTWFTGISVSGLLVTPYPYLFVSMWSLNLYCYDRESLINKFIVNFPKHSKNTYKDWKYVFEDYDDSSKSQSISIQERINRDIINSIQEKVDRLNQKLQQDKYNYVVRIDTKPKELVLSSKGILKVLDKNRIGSNHIKPDKFTIFSLKILESVMMDYYLFYHQDKESLDKKIYLKYSSPVIKSSNKKYKLPNINQNRFFSFKARNDIESFTFELIYNNKYSSWLIYDHLDWILREFEFRSNNICDSKELIGFFNLKIKYWLIRWNYEQIENSLKNRNIFKRYLRNLSQEEIINELEKVNIRAKKDKNNDSQLILSSLGYLKVFNAERTNDNHIKTKFTIKSLRILKFIMVDYKDFYGSDWLVKDQKKDKLEYFSWQLNQDNPDKRVLPSIDDPKFFSLKLRNDTTPPTMELSYDNKNNSSRIFNHMSWILTEFKYRNKDDEDNKRMEEFLNIKIETWMIRNSKNKKIKDTDRSNNDDTVKKTKPKGNNVHEVLLPNGEGSGSYITVREEGSSNNRQFVWYTLGYLKIWKSNKYIKTFLMVNSLKILKSIVKDYNKFYKERQALKLQNSRSKLFDVNTRNDTRNNLPIPTLELELIYKDNFYLVLDYLNWILKEFKSKSNDKEDIKTLGRFLDGEFEILLNRTEMMIKYFRKSNLEEIETILYNSVQEKVNLYQKTINQTNKKLEEDGDDYIARIDVKVKELILYPAGYLRILNADRDNNNDYIKVKFMILSLKTLKFVMTDYDKFYQGKGECNQRNLRLKHSFPSKLNQDNSDNDLPSINDPKFFSFKPRNDLEPPTLELIYHNECNSHLIYDHLDWILREFKYRNEDYEDSERMEELFNRRIRISLCKHKVDRGIIGGVTSTPSLHGSTGIGSRNGFVSVPNRLTINHGRLIGNGDPYPDTINAPRSFSISGYIHLPNVRDHHVSSLTVMMGFRGIEYTNGTAFEARMLLLIDNLTVLIGSRLLIDGNGRLVYLTESIGCLRSTSHQGSTHRSTRYLTLQGSDRVFDNASILSSIRSTMGSRGNPESFLPNDTLTMMLSRLMGTDGIIGLMGNSRYESRLANSIPIPWNTGTDASPFSEILTPVVNLGTPMPSIEFEGYPTVFDRDLHLPRDDAYIGMGAITNHRRTTESMDVEESGNHSMECETYPVGEVSDQIN